MIDGERPVLVFLKLGGSLITDKARAETPRPKLIRRIAEEIAQSLEHRPDLSLIIGHGSGSFGHTLARKYGTRQGVPDQAGWRGFAKVSVVAARLNQLVLDELDGAGIPIFKVQPSASAVCENGHLVQMSVKPIRQAIDKGLVPLIYGDVAFDAQLGGTIISTEEIFEYLARELRPRRILLAGDYDGVLDSTGQIVPHITPPTLMNFLPSLGESQHSDVTGGMAAKVSAMLRLCETIPDLDVWIFSGSRKGELHAALLKDDDIHGTHITA